MPKLKNASVFLGIFGHVNIDWIVDATKAPPIKNGPFFGGVAGNIAVGASRFGVPVRLGSVIGRNFPRSYFKLLKNLRIDLEFLQRNYRFETSSCLLTNIANGRQKKEICHGPHNRKVRMPSEFVHGLKYLHVSTGLPEACISVAKLGQDKGCKVVFDPGADLKRHYNEEHLRKALNCSKMFCANEDEIEVALGLLKERTYRDLRKYVQTIIITKAENGSLLLTPRTEKRIPAIKVQDVVDQTGVGDAYRSGLYAGLFRNLPLSVCCRLGAVAASECIKNKGAQGGLRSWSALKRLLRKSRL